MYSEMGYAYPYFNIPYSPFISFKLPVCSCQIDSSVVAKFFLNRSIRDRVLATAFKHKHLALSHTKSAIENEDLR